MREPDSQRHKQLLRFEQFGLRWNPFRIVRSDEAAAVYVNDLYDGIEQATAIAAAEVKFSQIIAPVGHGKSTFLRAIGAAFSEIGLSFEWCYLKPSLISRVPTPVSGTDVLIIDEAERLSRSNLGKLIRWCDRNAGRLIMSTHHDLTSRFPGDVLTVELPGITEGSLQRLFDTRIRWSGGDSKQFKLAPDAATWLIRNSGHNVRVIEAVLYEAFQAAHNGQTLCVTQQALEPWRRFATERAAQEAQDQNSLLSRIRFTFKELSGRTA